LQEAVLSSIKNVALMVAILQHAFTAARLLIPKGPAKLAEAPSVAERVKLATLPILAV
jgi:hypothetical protein